jgi:hypothetical protein
MLWNWQIWGKKLQGTKPCNGLVSLETNFFELAGQEHQQ